MTFRSDVLFAGLAEGEVLRLDAPISFWGGIDPASSEVVLAGHPQCGQKIAGKVLVVPQLVGSSSSSAILVELFYIDNAPLALILGGRDAILPVGVLVSQQMGWNTAPVVVMQDPPFQTGDVVQVREDGMIEVIASAG